MSLLLLVTGLLGALLMFCGDMLLYFSTEEYHPDGTQRPLIDIMKKIPVWRLKAGGFVGPIAAFFYCIGFGHLLLLFDEIHQEIAWAACLCLCAGIIMGGAYHSHWPYIGLMAKTDEQKAIDIVLKFSKNLSMVLYLLQGIGFLLLIVGVVMGWTAYPLFFVVFTPGFLFLLLPLLKKLPQPFYLCIVGGWSNLISVIYYIAALIYFGL